VLSSSRAGAQWLVKDSDVLGLPYYLHEIAQVGKLQSNVKQSSDSIVSTVLSCKRGKQCSLVSPTTKMVKFLRERAR